MFTFELDARSRVSVDFRDDDDGSAIDTRVYLRSTCTDDASQIICSDDVDCDAADPDIGGSCIDGVQYRQSVFDVTLDAGTYWLVADSYENGSFDCGTVTLTVTSAPL